MRQTFFFVIIILMLAALLVLVATLPARIDRARDSVKRLSGQVAIDYANKLLSKGLKEQAAQAFESYLDAGQLSPKDQARLLYKVGSIYMETYKYEQALKYFYKAELVDANAEFVPEMNRKIVEALENLGMNTQARYELEARAALGQEKVPKGQIVARIGKREISDSEIEEAIKSLPPWVEKNFADPQQRLAFIKEYVAREVLYNKAKRLGLDTKDAVRQSLEQVKKEIVIKDLLKKEINEKAGNINPDDVKLYFDANKERLSEKGKKSFEEVKREAEYEYKMKKQQEISEELFKKALEEQEVEIFYTANNNETKKNN